MLTSKFFRGLTATGPGSFGFRHQPLDLRDRIALRILLSQADGFAERFASAFRTRRRWLAPSSRLHSPPCSAPWNTPRPIKTSVRANPSPTRFTQACHGFFGYRFAYGDDDTTFDAWTKAAGHHAMPGDVGTKLARLNGASGRPPRVGSGLGC